MAETCGGIFVHDDNYSTELSDFVESLMNNKPSPSWFFGDNKLKGVYVS